MRSLGIAYMSSIFSVSEIILVGASSANRPYSSLEGTKTRKETLYAGGRSSSAISPTWACLGVTWALLRRYLGPLGSFVRRYLGPLGLGSLVSALLRRFFGVT